MTVSSTARERLGRRLGSLLDRPRYEVLPLPGTAEQVCEHVPGSLPVTVTASPRHGLEPTLALTETLARSGFRTVPHLAARLVRDRRHLCEILDRLDETGIRDVFVVAGDGSTPVGEYADAFDLLRALRGLRPSGIGRPPLSVGVTGYPEGHPRVSDDDLDAALLAKQPMSSYVVTQMCFDAGTIGAWVAHARARGLRVPVHAGVAGPVDLPKLLGIARRIGVGSSIRFLGKHRGTTRLLRPSGPGTDRVVEELASDDVPDERTVAGLHVYTFGDVASTERWRRELLERADQGETVPGEADQGETVPGETVPGETVPGEADQGETGQGETGDG